MAGTDGTSGVPVGPNRIVRLADTGNLPSGTTATINRDGNPVVAFQDTVASDLVVAACTDPACDQPAVVTVLDTAGIVGGDASITSGGTGNPVISYWDQTNTALKIAICGNPTCTSATIRTLDGAAMSSAVGRGSSVTTTAEGDPVVSYYDFTNTALKVVACTDPACAATPTVTTVDNAGNVGSATSIALGAGGNPVISYYDFIDSDLKVAACTDPACADPATITFIDGVDDVGSESSIAIGADGNPIISFYDSGNADLKVAVCADPACATPAFVTTLVSQNSVGRFSSIAVGAGETPVISYYDETDRDLEIAVCTDVLCADPPALTTLSTDGTTGTFTEVAIGRNGNPVVAHHDAAAEAPALAYCGTSTCSEFIGAGR